MIVPFYETGTQVWFATRLGELIYMIIVYKNDNYVTTVEITRTFKYIINSQFLKSAKFLSC